jgi:hypothetical protein
MNEIVDQDGWDAGLLDAGCWMLDAGCWVGSLIDHLICWCSDWRFEWGLRCGSCGVNTWSGVPVERKVQSLAFRKDQKFYSTHSSTLRWVTSRSDNGRWECVETVARS